MNSGATPEDAPIVAIRSKLFWSPTEFGATLTRHAMRLVMTIWKASARPINQ